MTTEEILQKAIDKALKNGMPYPIDAEVEKQKVIATLPSPYWSVFYWSRQPNLMDADHTYERKYTVNDIIFSHNFAKAFWGVETERLWECPKCQYSFEYFSHNETRQFCPNDGTKVKEVEKPISKWEQTWAKNLQEMVLEDNPFQYLEAHLLGA